MSNNVICTQSLDGHITRSLQKVLFFCPQITFVQIPSYLWNDVSYILDTIALKIVMVCSKLTFFGTQKTSDFLDIRYKYKIEKRPSFVVKDIDFKVDHPYILRFVNFLEIIILKRILWMFFQATNCTSTFLGMFIDTI